MHVGHPNAPADNSPGLTNEATLANLATGIFSSAHHATCTVYNSQGRSVLNDC
jgi:hypothetical protein